MRSGIHLDRAQALVTQLESFDGMDGGSLPALRSHLWLAGSEAERTAQSLRCDSPSFGQAARRLTRAPACSPLLTKMRKGLSELLRDVVTLEVALSRKTEAHILVRC